MGGFHSKVILVSLTSWFPGTSAAPAPCHQCHAPGGEQSHGWCSRAWWCDFHTVHTCGSWRLGRPLLIGSSDWSQLQPPWQRQRFCTEKEICDAFGAMAGGMARLSAPSLWIVWARGLLSLISQCNSHSPDYGIINNSRCAQHNFPPSNCCQRERGCLEASAGWRSALQARGSPCDA